MESEATGPSPKEIRDRIRSEHHALSKALVEIEGLAAAAHPDRADTLVALRDALHELSDTLGAHLQYEEFRLPALARDVASSEQLQEEMRQEHRAQRELLTRVAQDLDETAVGETLMVGVRELVRAIRDDMEFEEAEILSKL
ncbi:MAG: hemerythrin domain-containing protein [Myxococcota bacterium]